MEWDDYLCTEVDDLPYAREHLELVIPFAAALLHRHFPGGWPSKRAEPETRFNSLRCAAQFIKRRWVKSGNQGVIWVYWFKRADFHDKELCFVFERTAIVALPDNRGAWKIAGSLPRRVTWREAYATAIRAQTQALVEANIPPSLWPKSGVYLLHFDPKYKHAGHYLGFSEDILRRVEQHRSARRLNVSQCWVRRHLYSLPVVRLGRSIRVDGDRLPRACVQNDRLNLELVAAGAPPKPESETFMLRRYQRGSVFKTGKRIKVWYGMYRTDQLTPDGVRVRKQCNIRLGTAAQLPTKNAAMEALQRLMGSNNRPSTQMTFAELVQRWKTVQVPAMKASTAAHYTNALRAIEAVFNAAEIAAITRHDVERFIHDRARTHSRATLRSLRTTLSLVLGYAVGNSWLEKNPVAGIKLPREENCGGNMITRCVLTPVQVGALVSSLPEPYATLVLLLATTGLRIGECAGLRWSDLIGNTVHVQRRLYAGKLDDLKTKGSNRKLPLSPDIVARLKRLPTSDGFVFQSRNGQPLNPGNWMKRDIRPVARKLGIILTGWHDFRHYFGTQLRRGGAHPKVVSSLLGHARVHLAMDVYDHVDAEDMRVPVGKLSDQLLCDVMKSESAA